ncbi:MAG: SdpI family protein [Oscillospiraceae bacterium]|nr:SdpI family protein [Oscillospiraceae bacterium]
MNDKAKKRLVLTTIVALLPILLALILYPRLPDRVPIHFNSAGEADNWADKTYACFGMPCFFALISAFCQFVVANDPKRQRISEKMIVITAWTIPVISVLFCSASLMIAIGWNISIGSLVMLVLGILFLVIGNYLPKCKRNFTTGIKLPWTLASEDNWNYTHRIAGYTWIGAGLLFLVNVFVNGEWLFAAVLVLAVVIPVVASFLYYKRHS